jgi:ABC-type lipoprotein export system ATPase subunit
MIRAVDLRKTYDLGELEVSVLKGISFAIAASEFVSIMGPSGSGKSTLLNILGCLDSPSAGTYELDGRALVGLDDDALSKVRAREIGFVFQKFCLIKYLTVLDNVLLPLEYLNVDGDRAERTAREILARVRLDHRLDHRPGQLSGGECQRVAIARALVKGPRLILADEPTGNLDRRVEEEIIGLFRELNEQIGVTIVLVTHSSEVAAMTDRTIVIRDGVLA